MRLTNGEVLLRWPLSTHIITAGWTYNDGSAHNAIDLRAAAGTPVYAAEGGTVDQVQTWDGHTTTGMQSYGNMVRLRHTDYRGQALQTRYAHLTRVCVKAGQLVREGDLLGYSGETGNCQGAHLHFEVLLAGARCNPLNWLDGDFTCASTAVQAHLGSYTSVVPDDSDTTANATHAMLQQVCIVEPSEQIIARAQAMQVPVRKVIAYEIGPVSDGDAMTLWGLAQAEGSPYFASYTEV